MKEFLSTVTISSQDRPLNRATPGGLNGVLIAKLHPNAGTLKACSLTKPRTMTPFYQRSSETISYTSQVQARFDREDLQPV